jgi:hypothetical protein
MNIKTVEIGHVSWTAVNSNQEVSVSGPVWKIGDPDWGVRSFTSGIVGVVT